MPPQPAVAPAAALEDPPVIVVTMTVAAMGVAPAGAALEVMTTGPALDIPEAVTVLAAAAAKTAPAATDATQVVGATVAVGAAEAEAMEAGTVTRQTAQ